MPTVAESLPFPAGSDHFRVLEDGTVRIGKSRVSLDLVIEQYENGMDAEDLIRAYDTLALNDVNAAIEFYLAHRSEVEAYLARREEEAAALRLKIETERPPRITRDELLARRVGKGNGDAQGRN